MPRPTRHRSAATTPPEHPVTHRAAGDAPEIRDGRRLCFYAAVFNRYSLPLTEDGRTFREVVRPGAFTDTLANGGEVYGCLEHEEARTFARRSAGALLLTQDPRGLFASCYLEESPANDRILADVRAGVYRCSFGFVTVRDRWHEPKAGGPPLPLCELLAVRLVDVSLTRNPAYRETAVSVRAGGDRGRDRRLRLLKLRSV